MPDAPKKKRSRSKKVIITGASVTVNGIVYGMSAMQTDYLTSMPMPTKEEVQDACSECYMKLLCLFTNVQGSDKAKKATPMGLESPGRVVLSDKSPVSLPFADESPIVDETAK